MPRQHRAGHRGHRARPHRRTLHHPRPDHSRRRRDELAGRPPRRCTHRTRRREHSRDHLRVLGQFSPRVRLFYRPGLTGGIFPTNNGQDCVFVCLPAQQLPAKPATGTRGLYRRLLDQVAPGRFDPTTGPSPTQRLRVFTVRPGYLRRASGPGWALVGDAAYFKDPLTSHGLTDALRDAELLTRALLAAAAGEQPEPLALATYQNARDRLSASLFDTTDAIASFTWNLDQIPRLLKQLSAAMSDEVTLLEQLHSATAAA